LRSQVGAELARAVGAQCTAARVGNSTSAVRPYLVMTYLPGYRCGTTLTGRSKPADWLRSFGAALARMLTVVHARGAVHCDVKPSNLLVRATTVDVRVIDFGIARYVGERSGDDGTVQAGVVPAGSVGGTRGEPGLCGLRPDLDDVVRWAWRMTRGPAECGRAGRDL
jgi:serine/threonine protein kinase